MILSLEQRDRVRRSRMFKVQTLDKMKEQLRRGGSDAYPEAPSISDARARPLNV
jgi:hypothetical protein